MIQPDITYQRIQHDLGHHNYVRAIEESTALILLISANHDDRSKRLLCSVYCARGIAHRALDKHDDAIADFSAALQIMPNFSEALKQLGKYPAVQSGDLNEAKDLNRVHMAYQFTGSSLFIESVEKQLRLSQLHLQLGLLEQQQGDHESAMESFAMAEELCTMLANSHIHHRQSIMLARAKSLASQGEIKQADALLNVGSVLRSENDMAFLQAYLATLTGSDEVAEQKLNGVIRQSKIQPWAYVHRGKLYEKTNRRELAIADYQQGWRIGKALSGGSLYCLLQLHRLEALPPGVILAEVTAVFANYRQHCADDLCVLIMLLSAMRRNDRAKEMMANLLRDFLPQAVSHQLQGDYLRLLITPDNWSRQYQIQDDWLSDYKDQWLQMIRRCENTPLRLNAALQALSRFSQIGSVMHERRFSTKPSIAAGRLQKLASYLNDHAAEIANTDIYPATRELLENEAKSNTQFAQHLQQNYPDLFEVIKQVLNLQPQIVTRKQGYGFGQSIFGHVTRDAPSIQDETGNRFVLEL